jgi:hypothetical protein
LCLGWQRVRDYAARVSGERLSPGAVLEMVTAEALSALPLDAEAQEEVESPREENSTQRRLAPRPPDGAEGSNSEQLARTAGWQASEPRARCKLPAFLRSLVAGLDGTGPFELDARLRRAVRLEQRMDAAIGPLLRQVRSTGHEWGGRYRTLGEYVRDQLACRRARLALS